MQKKIKVNGTRIPPEAIQYELERLVRFHAEHGMVEAQVRQQLPDLMDKAIEQAIGARLLLDEAAKYDFPVSDEEVDAELAGIERQIGGGEALAEALRQQKTTLEGLRKQIKVGRCVSKLIDKACEEVSDPTEIEIKRHFDDHKEEYAQGERVLAQHILITPDGDTQLAKDEALERIKLIRERVKGGAEFFDEAAAHSMCPSGKEGGSLGWFGRGMMVAEFDQAVFDMKVGEISEVIETQFGFHIILKTDEEQGDEVELSQVHDKIRDFLRHERRGQATSALVEELKAKAKIEFE